MSKHNKVKCEYCGTPVSTYRGALTVHQRKCPEAIAARNGSSSTATPEMVIQVNITEACRTLLHHLVDINLGGRELTPIEQSALDKVVEEIEKTGA